MSGWLLCNLKADVENASLKRLLKGGYTRDGRASIFASPNLPFAKFSTRPEAAQGISSKLTLKATNLPHTTSLFIPILRDKFAELPV